MRKPKYLSYSALSLYESDIDEYVIRYLVDDRPDREQQGMPAGVGSAFDARVKAHLYEHTYGPGYMPELYSYDALFEKQVEPQNRDFCKPAGDYVFECYKISGMLERFRAMADKSVVPPQYEFTLEKTVGGVPLLGKPDGMIRIPYKDSTVLIVLDWKVNGYCSKSAVSPTPGFLLCMDGYVAPKQSASNGTTHKNATVSEFKGVNIGGNLEDSSEQWASQLTGYAWTLDAEIGSGDVVFMIHQCVAKPRPDTTPLLRFAEFAGPVRKPYQDFLLKRYQKLWSAIEAEHIYPELSLVESQARYELIKGQASSMVADGKDSIWVSLIRPTWRGK